VWSIRRGSLLGIMLGTDLNLVCEGYEQCSWIGVPLLGDMYEVKSGSMFVFSFVCSFSASFHEIA
jgi:hypothetical protein